MTYYTQEEIDENRRKWLAQLRDLDSKKEFGQLENVKDSNARCCLGHACHALGIRRRVKQYPSSSIDLVAYENTSGALPSSACYMLNITAIGRFIEKIIVNGESCSDLSDVNDNTLLSPAEIADVIQDQFNNNNFEQMIL